LSGKPGHPSWTTPLAGFRAHAGVSINALAACVWVCLSDGGFDEVARFYLPYDRPPGPVRFPALDSSLVA